MDMQLMQKRVRARSMIRLVHWRATGAEGRRSETAALEGKRHTPDRANLGGIVAERSQGPMGDGYPLTLCGMNGAEMNEEPTKNVPRSRWVDHGRQ